MKKNEMLQAMKDIEKAFNQKFTKDQLEMWYKYLGDIALISFEQAIKHTLLSVYRFPAIADIYISLKKIPPPLEIL